MIATRIFHDKHFQLKEEMEGGGEGRERERGREREGEEEKGLISYHIANQIKRKCNQCSIKLRALGYHSLISNRNDRFFMNSVVTALNTDQKIH